MFRFNPEPDFLTTNSFNLAGAGAGCYAFLNKKQAVIPSCYARYNVVLRFFRLFSKGYSVLLQNSHSHACICACVRMRSHTRAPTRVHSVYIATKCYKILYLKRKTVVRSCSSGVVWSSYSENNKILGIYSGKNPAAEPAGQTVGWGAADAEMSAGVVSGANCKKWRISAVFGVPFKAMFNATMFNVIQKAQSSAVFQAVRTFFLKMFPFFNRTGGIPPQSDRKHHRYIRFGFFFDFRAELLFGEIGRSFIRSGLGITGFGE